MNEIGNRIFDYYKEIHGYRDTDDPLAKDACDRDLVDDLINSHRYLRSLNLELNEERKKIMKDAYDTAYRDAAMKAIEQDWISADKLRSMSLMELVNFLHED